MKKILKSITIIIVCICCVSFIMPSRVEASAYKRALTSLQVNGYKIYNSSGKVYVTYHGRMRVASNSIVSWEPRLISNGKYLFFSNGKSMIRYTLKTGAKKVCAKTVGDYSLVIKRYSNGYVYYSSENGQDSSSLIRVKISNGKKEWIGLDTDLLMIIGKKIVFTDAASTIGMMDMNGKNKKIIAKNVVQRGAQYTNGNIYYIKKMSGHKYSLYSYNVSSKNKKLKITFTSDNQQYEYPKISSNGRYIIINDYGYYYRIDSLTGKKVRTSVSAYNAIKWEL